MQLIKEEQASLLRVEGYVLDSIDRKLASLFDVWDAKP